MRARQNGGRAGRDCLIRGFKSKDILRKLFSRGICQDLSVASCLCCRVIFGGSVRLINAAVLGVVVVAGFWGYG